MKKIAMHLLVLSIVLFAMGNVYAFEETQNMHIEARVAAQCSLEVVPLNFGDVTGASAEFTTGQVTVTCIYDVPYQISFDAGNNLGGGSDPQLRSLHDGTTYYASYDITDISGTDLGDNCVPGSRPFPGVCLSGVGNDQNQSYLLSLRLSTFNGIPAGTVMSDDVTVTLHY